MRASRLCEFFRCKICFLRLVVSGNSCSADAWIYSARTPRETSGLAAALVRLACSGGCKPGFLAVVE
eukprot:2220098-Pyramimonas_sp.AAC.1